MQPLPWIPNTSKHSTEELQPLNVCYGGRRLSEVRPFQLGEHYIGVCPLLDTQRLSAIGYAEKQQYFSFLSFSSIQTD